MSQSNEQSPAPPAQQSPQELQQLVAPIALYPDALVAQILAASTYPTEIVEADRWMQSHSNLKGEELAKEVDKQPWDPSVKALAQFPSVLENMDKNLSWSSSLGDAYANDPQGVTDAVQTMRQQARQAGKLNSNVPGIFLGGAGIGFGIGFGVGFFGGFGWGWHHWGYDWHGRRAIYNHNTYVSHSRTIVNRNNFNRGNLSHGNFNHGNAFHGSNSRVAGGSFHGSSAPHFQPGTRSSAFSGFDHGGNARGFSSRGRSSFGGGSHGGGGRH
jgi:hypothetical protein